MIEKEVEPISERWILSVILFNSSLWSLCNFSVINWATKHLVWVPYLLMVNLHSSVSVDFEKMLVPLTNLWINFKKWQHRPLVRRRIRRLWYTKSDLSTLRIYYESCKGTEGETKRKMEREVRMLVQKEEKNQLRYQKNDRLDARVTRTIC